MGSINPAAIVEAYNTGASMTEIAAAQHVSRQTVRRVLIDAGSYANSITIHAQARLSEGATLDDVAAELGVQRETVRSNLPHSRGPYKRADATKNALAIRAMRARRKERQ